MKSNPNMKAIDMKTGLLECSDAKWSKKKTHENTELSQTVFACQRKKKGVEWAAMQLLLLEEIF